MQIEISAGASAAENVGICFLRCFFNYGCNELRKYKKEQMFEERCLQSFR